MYKNDNVIRRYSAPFKLKMLDELSTGKLNNNQLGKLYGINPTTSNEWIRKYNRKDLMNIRVNVATKDLTHHSDRGIRYCSNLYTQLLKRKKIHISMTEENHCYENALSERVNGILKDEFYLDQTFFGIAQAKRATKNAIKLYNQVRLHLPLDFKTPDMVSKQLKIKY